MSEEYRAYQLRNFRGIPEVDRFLTEEEKFAIEVVGNILPFKANNYVVEELIDWENFRQDPIYALTFPTAEMLEPHHFAEMADLLTNGASKPEIQLIANKIRKSLNPHPAGQMDHNVPSLDDVPLTGIQHKYSETLLFFPNQGQTCHAYCTFCFRWPQFVGMNELKFAMRDTELLVRYLREHPEITDVLFTGGDPMIMKTRVFSQYIDALIDARLPNLRTIRIGTKALSYWPQRFVTDEDADQLLLLFEKVNKAGIHLAFMAHFNHTRELETDMVKTAISRVLQTGAVIRTQSPIMRKINDDAEVWAAMWQKQVELGCIPYYMFVARDTGAQHYFALPLDSACSIFNKAYRKVSGIARTVRGPSMSATAGKVQVSGVSEIMGEKVFVLRFLQARDAKWVGKPFFALHDPEAIWLDELKPAFGKSKFFFDTHPIPLHTPGRQALKN